MLAVAASLALGSTSASYAETLDQEDDEASTLESGLTPAEAYEQSVQVLRDSQLELNESRIESDLEIPILASPGMVAAAGNVAFPKYFSAKGLEGVACVTVIADVFSCRTARNHAQSALNLAAARYPKSVHNGKGDAFRHCYWNGLMTVSLGASTAKRIASNHEAVSTNPTKEKNMDLYNNGRGRWVGKTYKTTFAADTRCTELLGRSIGLGGLQTSL